MQKVFTFGFIFFIIFDNGESMKCYVCRSDDDSDCNGTPDDSYLKECPRNGTLCRKISQKLKFKDEGSWTSIRECAYEKGHMDCYNFKWLALGYQETCECDTEGCNRGRVNIMTKTFVMITVYNIVNSMVDYSLII